MNKILLSLALFLESIMFLVLSNNRPGYNDNEMAFYLGAISAPFIFVLVIYIILLIFRRDKTKRLKDALIIMIALELLAICGEIINKPYQKQYQKEEFKKGCIAQYKDNPAILKEEIPEMCGCLADKFAKLTKRQQREIYVSKDKRKILSLASSCYPQRIYNDIKLP